MSGKNKKRVLHLIYSGGVYGAESVILNLSREMLASDDYEPVIGCMVQREGDQVDLIDAARRHGIEAVPILFRNRLFVPDTLSLAKEFRRLNVSVVHSHGYKPTVFGFVAASMIGVPMLSTCHLWYFEKTTPLRMHALVKTELFLYRYFEKVVAVSNEIAQVLRDAGLGESKVEVVPNGIVLDDYARPTEAERTAAVPELGVEAGDFCVVNVGRLTDQKAQHLLIEAAEQLRSRGHSLKYLIVGDGELREELTEQARARKVDDIVRFLGFRSDVAKILRRANAFALPSRDEGMPMAMLEAAASRVPLVTTDVGNIGEIVENEQSGIVVAQEDAEGLARALGFVVENPERAQEMSEEAYDRVVRSYSSQAMMKSYRDIYDQISQAAR